MAELKKLTLFFAPIDKVQRSMIRYQYVNERRCENEKKIFNESCLV